MSTFVLELLSSLDSRLQEINILIDAAKNEDINSNKEKYNVFCRSVIVLLVAHYEGFYKDCIKAILDDINKFSSFDKATNKMKRTFCELFISEPDKNPKKINILIETFDSLETKLRPEPFLFQNNKNPSPDIIKTICKRFGIDYFFYLIENSDIDIVFEESKSNSTEILKEIKKHITKGVKNFPYNLDPKKFNFDLSKKVRKNKKRTLWEEFLDQLMESRNNIAHGITFENGKSIQEIELLSLKILLLKYTLILVLCNQAVSDMIN